MLLLVKLQAPADVTKSNTPPWVFFRFLSFKNSTKLQSVYIDVVYTYIYVPLSTYISIPLSIHTYTYIHIYIYIYIYIYILKGVLFRENTAPSICSFTSKLICMEKICMLATVRNLTKLEREHFV